MVIVIYYTSQSIFKMEEMGGASSFHTLINLQDLDALIIPGGFAPDYWRRDKRFVGLVRAMYESGKTVAAICHGAWMFCSAGILKGKRVTCFCSVKDDVINAGYVNTTQGSK